MSRYDMWYVEKPDKAEPNAKELLTLEYWEIPENTYLTPRQVKERLGIAVNTLANWRVQGKNLVLHKDGSLIRYPIYGKGALLDYLQRHSGNFTI